MKKLFLLIFLICLSTGINAQSKSGSKSSKTKSGKVSVKKNSSSSSKSNQLSHTCNHCGKTFYGKGYYLSYSSSGLEMLRSDNESQELCCSTKCANDIMGF